MKQEREAPPTREALLARVPIPSAVHSDSAMPSLARRLATGVLM